MQTKRKYPKKLILNTVKNTAILALLLIGMFFAFNDALFKAVCLPSSYDIVEFFGCGPKPYVKLTGGESSVSFIDVGQGDCELIRTKNHNILIDSGESENAGKVITFLKYSGVTKLDMIIISHQHNDHYGGIDQIVDEFSVGQVIMPELPYELIPVTVTQVRLIQTLERLNIPIRYAKSGERFPLEEDSYIEILAPVYDDYEELNNFSIVARYVHGEKSFLFTGDIERMGELDLLELGVDLDSDVLKVPHHGSAGSSSEEFLAAVTPELAVFEAAEINLYYHPRAEVIYRLLDAGCTTTYSTANNGCIVMICDGTDIHVICEKNSALVL